MAPDLILPAMAASSVDIGRLIREMENIDEAFLQMNLRKSDKQTKLPQTSWLLDKIVADNQLNLLKGEDREALKTFLYRVKSTSPVLHMSFSADPSPRFLERLVTWLRSEIHPFVLLNVGLQPNIGAGCILRTTNHYFDMSLKNDFMSKRALLLKAIVEAENSVEQAAAEVTEPSNG